jgi:hypothetical protein
MLTFPAELIARVDSASPDVIHHPEHDKAPHSPNSEKPHHERRVVHLAKSPTLIVKDAVQFNPWMCSHFA